MHALVIWKMAICSCNGKDRSQCMITFEMRVLPMQELGR